MEFRDEFETQVNGETFYVQVEGVEEEGIKDLTLVSITDEQDNEVTNDHEAYAEIYEEALVKDYEVHSRDFDYYEAEFNNFLKED